MKLLSKRAAAVLPGIENKCSACHEVPRVSGHRHGGRGGEEGQRGTIEIPKDDAVCKTLRSSRREYLSKLTEEFKTQVEERTRVSRAVEEPVADGFRRQGDCFRCRIQGLCIWTDRSHRDLQAVGSVLVLPDDPVQLPPLVHGGLELKGNRKQMWVRPVVATLGHGSWSANSPGRIDRRRDNPCGRTGPQGHNTSLPCRATHVRCHASAGRNQTRSSLLGKVTRLRRSWTVPPLLPEAPPAS